jgi:hypothetical protein
MDTEGDPCHGKGALMPCRFGKDRMLSENDRIGNVGLIGSVTGAGGVRPPCLSMDETQQVKMSGSRRNPIETRTM